MPDLAMELARALDPATLFRDATRCEPDAYQKDVLRSTAPRTLLNIHRQGGKSLACAVLALHQALYIQGSLVLLLSPSLRQSSELFRKVLDAFNTLNRPVEVVAESALRLELANGSRIIALPGTERTTRGHSGVGLLIVDEAARVEDELYYSLRPMLAVSRGRLLALSTPAGRRGWWWREWSEGGPAWQRFRVPASECRRIDHAFLEQERRSLGERAFAQEYCCEFGEVAAALFSSSDIAALFREGVEAW